MAGRGKAPRQGEILAEAVIQVGEDLGLEIHEQFEVGRRIWGAKRSIDVLLIHKETRKALGIECKFQSEPGSVEEKIPATIKDIEAWPIPGLVVFAGDGFSENMKAFLISTGKAIEFEALEPWLCLFFGLPVNQRKHPRVRIVLPAKRPGPSDLPLNL